MSRDHTPPPLAETTAVLVERTTQIREDFRLHAIRDEEVQADMSKALVGLRSDMDKAAGALRLAVWLVPLLTSTVTALGVVALNYWLRR